MSLVDNKIQRNKQKKNLNHTPFRTPRTSEIPNYRQAAEAEPETYKVRDREKHSGKSSKGSETSMNQKRIIII